MHAKHGGTYIDITNDIESARRIADYLVVLWKGRVIQSGDRDDMFTSPNPFVRRFPRDGRTVRRGWSDGRDRQAPQR